VEHPQSPVSTVLPIIVIFVVFLLRARSMSKLQPMRLKALWIRPAIVCAVAGLFLYSAPPHGVLQALILLVTLGVGALLGWHQAKMMQITVDAETGRLQVKASLLAIATFFGIIMARMALRPWLMAADSPLHAYIGLVTDAFILFFVGFACANATEMFIRGRALLSGASAKSSG
jgi:hypothetical protein